MQGTLFEGSWAEWSSGQDSEFILVVALQDVVAVILFLASMAVVTPERMHGSYEKGLK